MPSAPKFEWPQGEPLFEVMWRSVSESLAGNGILTNTDLEVTATANTLEIQVASGTAYYIGTEYTLGTAETHTLTSGDGTYDRWDTVYFDTATTSSGVREGTAQSNPEPPDIQSDELALAFVYVPSSASDVSGSNILNWRAKFSNEAEEVHYDDSSGTFSVSNVDAALDSLTEASQLSAYPLAPGTDLSVNGYPFQNGDLNNSTVTVNAGSGISTTSASIALGGSATLSIDLSAALTWTGQQTWDSALEVQEIATPSTPPTGYGRTYFKSDGFLYALDDAGTERNVHSDKKTASVTANYTTSGESVVFVDPSGTGGVTITLASADAVDGRAVTVIDTGGTAGTNPITIDTGSTESIDGGSSVTLNTDNSEYRLETDGANWFVAGGASASQAIAAPNVFEGRESGSIAAGDQGIVAIDNVQDTDSVEVYKAALTLSDAQAVPSGVNMELVTFDNAGAYTTQATIASGDGSTVFDRETGDPLASYQNTSGSAQSIGVIVDNTTASSVNIMAAVEGEVPV